MQSLINMWNSVIRFPSRIWFSKSGEKNDETTIWFYTDRIDDRGRDYRHPRLYRDTLYSDYTQRARVTNALAASETSSICVYRVPQG